MSYSRRPGRNAGSGIRRSPSGSGIRRPPPPPPRPVSVYDDDDDDQQDDDHWGETGGDWDEAPRRTPARGSRGSRGGRAARDGRGSRGRRGRGRGGRREHSSEGTGAFICSIIGLVACAPLGLIGLIMGLNAVSSARARGQEPSGMATAAIWLGGVACVFFLLALIIVFGLR